MMHSIKIISRKKEGRRKTLYLRIIKNRKVRLISLGIHIQEEDWDECHLKVLETHPNHIYLNCFIHQKFLDAERTAIMLLTKSSNTTVDAIKLAVSGRTGSDFTHYFSSYKDRLLTEGKIGSHIKVKSSFSKLSQFSDGKRLNFEDVTVTFLKKTLVIPLHAAKKFQEHHTQQHKSN